MLTRVLAYALEYRENLEFSRGLSESDEPALFAKDLTGKMVAWIEVGSPSPERLHRARKSCEYVAVYTFREVKNLLELYRKAEIYRAETINLHAIEPELLEGLESKLERRCKLSLTRSDGTIFCELSQTSLQGAISSYLLRSEI